MADEDTKPGDGLADAADKPRATRPDPHSPATKAAAKKQAALDAAARSQVTGAESRKRSRKSSDDTEIGTDKVASRSGDPKKRAAAQATQSRYTPPIPMSAKVSPWYVPVLMFGFLGLGMVIIFLNYIGWPFGDPSNWRLLIGLGSILAGILVATRYQ